MSNRMSASQALKLGIITPAQYETLKRDGRRGRTGDSNRRRASNKVDRLNESPPQRLLFEAIDARWPARFTWELPVKPQGAPRAYSLDIASVSDHLCIEMDGWQYHGRFKKDFQRDRVRQNRLSVEGWRILRFFPKQVYSDMPGILAVVERALSLSPTVIVHQGE